MKLMDCVKIDCDFVEVAFKDQSDFQVNSKYRARRTRKEEQGDNKKDLDITRKSEFVGLVNSYLVNDNNL